ncbi:UNKNOWN [Stylonychia lemnae]|uniref:Uncharacterized protein n=1 Tax=Stylonychia lemnae TaxID=5949 RepID=A0A078ADR8_STYLE|nr:UNKNOWN [Stylonychia lemnae]|eukprot:CDW79043.1 UNKNOWN [Stylonychia lemnae]
MTCFQTLTNLLASQNKNDQQVSQLQTSKIIVKEAIQMNQDQQAIPVQSRNREDNYSNEKLNQLQINNDNASQNVVKNEMKCEICFTIVRLEDLDDHIFGHELEFKDEISYLESDNSQGNENSQNIRNKLEKLNAMKQCLKEITRSQTTNNQYNSSEPGILENLIEQRYNQDQNEEEKQPFQQQDIFNQQEAMHVQMHQDSLFVITKIL